MAKELDDPPPPLEIWTALEADLEAERAVGPQNSPRREQTRFPGVRPLHLWSTAALLLIAVGGIWMAPRVWPPARQHRELTADFAAYLAHSPENPARAQQFLLAKYGGEAVDLVQAAGQLGYAPAVAAGLPERFALEAVYLLKMPCCTCVQMICRRDDGTVIAIFEHTDEHPASYGDHPHIDASCSGCPCRIIQADRGLVASWMTNRRYITVVGVHDLRHVADLIAHFQSGVPEA